ncbi:unnamed protein product, partial [Staurois parvus]
MNATGNNSSLPRHHWTLEQWRHVLWSGESHFSVWQSDGRVWLVVARRMVLACLHCAKC